MLAITTSGTLLEVESEQASPNMCFVMRKSLARKVDFVKKKSIATISCSSIAAIVTSSIATI